MKDKWTSLRAALDTSEEATPGVISGIAVAYNVDVPRGPRLAERVAPGAFSAQVKAPNRVAVLWQHDTDSPIGRATKLTDSEEHLRFVAKISEHEDIPEARKALALLREGIVDEISVGFEWGTWTEQRDEASGRTTILHTKARLREFSVVTFGALGRDARVVSVAASGYVIDPAAMRARLDALRS
jgi:HK97 family phage prohead protease